MASDIVVDGQISANGHTGAGYSAGSGSGGSIRIQTSTLSGTGTVQANGGAHQVGGGGGRIAVHYDTLYLPGANITATGGAGSNAAGQDGTVHLEEQ